LTSVTNRNSSNTIVSSFTYTYNDDYELTATSGGSKW